MSDDIITNSEVVNENTEVVEEPQGSETDWKSEARKWEKRAKEANSFRDAAEKWYEYEKSLKPEQERIADELNNLRNEATSAKMALVRYEVAAEKGIPADAIKLLTGSNREELEDSANTLMALIAKQSETRAPKPDPTQGRVAAAGSTTADQFAAALSDIL